MIDTILLEGESTIRFLDDLYKCSAVSFKFYTTATIFLSFSSRVCEVERPEGCNPETHLHKSFTEIILCSPRAVYILPHFMGAPFPQNLYGWVNS